MASIDLEAGKVRLTDREMVAAVMLATEPGSPKLRESVLTDEITRLGDAGLFKDGALDPDLARLVTVVARPQLRLMLERVTPTGLAAYGVFATPQSAVVAVPVDGEEPTADYSAMETAALPITLFGLAQVGRRPVPKREGHVTLKQADLDAAGKAAEAKDADGVEAALRKAGLEDPWLAAFKRLLLERQGSWRLSGGWADAKGNKHLGSLTVIDGGQAGLWRVKVPDDADPNDPNLAITVTPVAPSTVWKDLLALLPLRRAAEGH
jgi:hypothetical protein